MAWQAVPYWPSRDILETLALALGKVPLSALKSENSFLSREAWERAGTHFQHPMNSCEQTHEGPHRLI